MCNFVFPNDILKQPLLCLTRAIFAPMNAQIDAYNDHILCHIPGESQDYMSADSLQEGRSNNSNNARAILYSIMLQTTHLYLLIIDLQTIPSLLHMRQPSIAVKN